MGRAALIGGLEFVAFLMAAINFRACARGKILPTLATDALIAGFGFTLVQKVANATTWLEQGCYVLGAVLGSLSGMLLTRHWDHEHTISRSDR